jgi:predicted CoA-binding protein
VDVFRPSPEEVDALAVTAIHIGAKVLWQQLRINSIAAATRALEAGLVSIVDACIKMEHGRYSGGLHSVGMNTELVTARRPRVAGSNF